MLNWQVSSATKSLSSSFHLQGIVSRFICESHSALLHIATVTQLRECGAGLSLPRILLPAGLMRYGAVCGRIARLTG